MICLKTLIHLDIAIYAIIVYFDICYNFEMFKFLLCFVNAVDRHYGGFN